MSVEKLYEALNRNCWHGPAYDDDKCTALHDALQEALAKPDATLDIALIELTCWVCGLPEWQEYDLRGVADEVRDRFAEDSNPPAGHEEWDEDQLVDWYVEHHDCEHHSPFAPPSTGFSDHQRYLAELDLIYEALQLGSHSRPANLS